MPHLWYGALRLKERKALKLTNHDLINVEYPKAFPPNKTYSKKNWEKINIDIISWEKPLDRSVVALPAASAQTE